MEKDEEIKKQKDQLGTKPSKAETIIISSFMLIGISLVWTMAAFTAVEPYPEKTVVTENQDGYKVAFGRKPVEDPDPGFYREIDFSKFSEYSYVCVDCTAAGYLFYSPVYVVDTAGDKWNQGINVIFTEILHNNDKEGTE